MDVQKAIEKINTQLDNVKDPVAKVIIEQLLNIIEYQAQEIKVLKAENQRLRDENNRLKGGPSKPNIRKQSNNHSSKKNRKPRGQQKKNKKSKCKNNKITINCTVKCKVNKNKLPEDAIFKGYKSVVVQDIIIKTNNTKFIKEVYYSPSLNKTFMANLPKGYDGAFGPHIKSLIINQHFVHRMPEPAIMQFLQSHGVAISAATISRIITDNHEQFHSEKKEIVDAGLQSSVYQQLDDTSARVNGRNNFTHVLCNPYYTAYFTKPNKNRLTILEILNQKPLTFQFNSSAYALMRQMELSQEILTKLKKLKPKPTMNRKEIEQILDNLFPIANKHARSRRIILEASAITAYLNSSNAIKILLTDDAKQFKQITEYLALCWVHDGRHYKKLSPAFAVYQKKLDLFLNKYWDYYHKLLNYKKKPSKSLANKLEKEFDKLFSTATGYTQLEERIARTKLKKDSLLLVLKYPELPLHNNTSELGARAQARYRDISFQTKNAKGTESKDTFMTIIETAKKLGINTYSYIFDRVSNRFKMPSLASLVAEYGAT